MKLVYLTLLIFCFHGFGAAIVGQPAPKFSLTGHDGKTYKLEEFKNKKMVVLEWFNNECPFVKKHYDSGHMQHLQEKYVSKDLAWFSISSSAKGKQGYLEATSAKKVFRDRKMASTALLLDPGSRVARDYGAQTTPHMFLIDKSGLVAYNGAIDSENSAKPMKLAEYEKDESIKKFVELAITDLRSDRKVANASTEPYGCSVKYP